MSKKPLGDIGELVAERFLKAKGMKILERNCRTPFGEIDIVAMDGRTLVFVEVKTRTSGLFGSGAEAIDGRKKKKLERSALYYTSRKDPHSPSRFDVISICLVPEGSKVEHIKDAFEAGPPDY